MTKIFKQLARHWAVCLVVFALLFVQAYCDLSLPDYTSRIVDTGIQQGGIESPLPQTVRQSTLDALSLLMSEEDAQKLQNAYQYYLQDDGVLQLRSDLTEDERTALEEAVTTPDIVLYMAAAQAANTPAGQNSMGMTGLAETPSAAADADTETATPTAADLDTVCSQFAAMSQMPGFDRSMLQKQLDGAMSQLDSTLLENLKSQSLLLVQLEYEAQGVAQDVQMGYLFRVGGQMLALTLLMVAVAVAVGFLASRVSAAIGRDLRRETFSSVIGFSNAEIENFSTASLITRTTNDIQQVQFVCVILLRMVAYAPILGIGGVLHVINSSTGLSWIIVLDVAVLLLLIIFLMNIAMPKFKIMQNLVDRLNLVSREILTGIMPVRAFSREAFEEQRFDKANRDLMGTQLFTNRAMVAMMPFMTLIMNGTSLLIVWFGGKAMDAGNMQVGEMIAFITYTMQIVMSFLMLAMVAVMLPRAGVAADRIDEVIRTKATIRDPDEAARIVATPSDWEAAADAHRRSVVLLKNDGTLPLTADKRANKKIYAEAFLKNAKHAADSTAALRKELADTCTLVDDPAQADFALLFVSPSSGEYFNATPGYLELDICEDKTVCNVDANGKPMADTHTETTLHGGKRLAEIAASVHANGGKVITNVNITLAWQLGNVEPLCDVLLAGFDTYRSATLDVIFGCFAPTGKLPLTLPRGDAVLAVNADGVCISPNDVPGYDKDRYMPDSLKDENGKAYAYRDAAGNYYEYGFGLEG